MHAKWMKQTMVILAVLLAVVLATSAAYGQTLYVPDDFATIQTALDAADDLYTIIVRDGVYTGAGNKDLDFKGKALTLRSENGPKNCIIDCEGEGRGAYFHNGESPSSTLDGFTVTNGFMYFGGGIDCEDSSPTIINCNLNNNGSYNGGGIACSGSSQLLIVNCTITLNWVHVDGGGAYSSDSAQVTIINCIVSANSAVGFGGGISSQGASMTISQCDIRDNQVCSRGASSNGGGGIDSGNGSSLTITDCVITGNTSEAYGGGLHFRGNSSATVSDCTISDNSAAGGWGGGGISCYYSSSVTVSECTINANSAGRGGGINSYSYSPTVISGCTISNNSADIGGGICGENSLMTVTDCIVGENRAQAAGGGIDVFLAATIVNCVIAGNTSEQWGGALILRSQGSTITNCIINGNLANVNGGGIYCQNSSNSLTNCTIANNSAGNNGGGMYCGSSSPTLTNCILSGDSAPNGSELALMDASVITLNYSNVNGGMSAVFVEPGATIDLGIGNISADPIFVAGPLGDYYLSQQAAGQGVTSPCVNAGIGTASNFGLESYTTRTDEMGDGGIVDMGYHYPGFAAGALTHINCTAPANETVADSPPTFSWTANGGTNNVFVVDIAVSLRGPMYTSPAIQGETFWTMPQQWWDAIPSGSFVYWRVRGADLDATPLSIIYSDEIWWFYKP